MNRIVHVNAGKVDARYEGRTEYGDAIDAVHSGTYSGALMQLGVWEQTMSMESDYDIDQIVADFLKHEGC